MSGGDLAAISLAPRRTICRKTDSFKYATVAFLELRMLTKESKTEILVDGGDPAETLRVKNLLGFVDGQTTNPSLIAKNPEIQRQIASGHTLTSQAENDDAALVVAPLVRLLSRICSVVNSCPQTLQRQPGDAAGAIPGTDC
jgi:hypothetical protein